IDSHCHTHASRPGGLDRKDLWFEPRPLLHEELVRALEPDVELGRMHQRRRATRDCLARHILDLRLEGNYLRPSWAGHGERKGCTERAQAVERAFAPEQRARARAGVGENRVVVTHREALRPRRFEPGVGALYGEAHLASTHGRAEQVVAMRDEGR